MQTANMAPLTQPKTRIYFLDKGASHGTDGHLKGHIASCNPDGSDMKYIVENIGSAPDGITIDVENEHIYYTNMATLATDSGFISRVDMDGQNNIVIVPQGVTWTPKQIVLELSQPNKKMYWCDREGMRVFRANLDGSDIEILVKNGEGDKDRADATNWCVGISVDQKRGLFYWTQKGPSKGNKGRLFCAGLSMPDGETAENRSDKKLLLDKLPEPIDIDLDIENNVLYYTDRGDPPFGNTINKVDLNTAGEHKKEVLVRKLHEAIGLTLDIRAQKMYFTDLNGSAYSANMDGSDEKVILPDDGDLTGIVCVYH
ncbi:hypothetical protein Dsin_033154 [Dipteronia sinensis]|uniref:Uncharacterized protein n=1 Tax=Dipteronia sinensis TaxID=43782 RepID=A0AAD9Z4G1_9ROSI|nr:hypothetical protein Dsin_033154 [Dipteronia sinensis]